MTEIASSSRTRPNVSLDLDSPELASTYDRVSTGQFNHGKVLIEALHPARGERVLNVGCEIRTIEELRGKQVAYQKGTNIQLAVAKIITAHGLTEHDFRAVNIDNETAKSAIIIHSVDAAFGQYDYLQLRDQGTARIIYVANGEDNPSFLKHSTLIGSEAFVSKYPEITERVVKVLVQTAKWQSDQEANPAPLFQLWTKSGVPFNDWREDLQKNSVKQLASPLVDDYIRAQYKRAVDDSKRFGLIRNTFDVDSWVDTSFLQKALHELNLESYWPQYDANGKVRGSS